MDWKGPILDDHFHLNRNGRFLDAAKDFLRGGTDPVLVHCPDFAAPPVTREGHYEAYADTIAMAEKVRELGLGVRVILGPHPAAFAHQFEPLGERAEENYWDSIETALEFVKEGKAHGIGEVVGHIGRLAMRFAAFEHIVARDYAIGRKEGILTITCRGRIR